MGDRFRRGGGEKILFEATGAKLMPGASLGEKLRGAHVDLCKLFVTNERVVWAKQRQWAQTRSPIVMILVPFFWIATAFIPRPLLHEVPLADLVSCTYAKRKGRFVFADKNRSHVFVSHGFHRNGQSRKLFSALAEIAPLVRCAVFERKGDLTPEAIASLYD